MYGYFLLQAALPLQNSQAQRNCNSIQQNYLKPYRP